MAARAPVSTASTPPRVRLPGRVACTVPAVSEPVVSEPVSRRQQAVARTLDPARERAEQRVQAFLDAALELLTTADAKDFTVQQVVDRSGQSLRSFYQHFAGKHELLLALFEENVRTTADHIAATLEDVEDPAERLHVFTTEYYRTCLSGVPSGSGTNLPPKAIGEFAYQLLADPQEEASEAFKPLVSMLGQLLADAAAAGAIRSDLEDEVAGVLLQVIMFNTFAPRISGRPPSENLVLSGDRLWELILHGLAPRDTE